MHLGPDADGHDRLAECDQNNQAVALGEVAGRELPALGPEEVGATHVQRQRENPNAGLREPVQRRGDDEQADPDGGADR